MEIVQIYKLFPTQEDYLKHTETVCWNSKSICSHRKSNKFVPLKEEGISLSYICPGSYGVTGETTFHKNKFLNLKVVFLLPNEQKSSWRAGNYA